MLRITSVITALMLGMVPSVSGLNKPIHIPNPDFWITSVGGQPTHYVDHAVFPAGADSMRVDVFYSASYDLLPFRELGGGDYEARLKFVLRCTPDGANKPTRQVARDRSVRAEKKVIDDGANYRFLHVVTVTLPRTAHHIRSSVGSAEAGVATADADFWCNPPAEGGAGLSFGEVQLVYEIAAANEGDRYVKNGLRVTPLPTRRYLVGSSKLIFYTENHNGGSSPASLHVRYGIQTLYGEDLWGGDEGRVNGGILELPPGSSPKVGGMDVTSLDSGFYRFVMEYLDPSGTVVCQQRRIFVYQKDATPLSAPDPYVASLDDAALNAYSEKFLKYLGSPQARSRYGKSPSRPARRLFIERWWGELAEAAGAPVQPFRAMILQRYERADRDFADPYRDGWRTDRGRILIVYGEPIEIERDDVSYGGHPYEFWEMVIKGERKFCHFVDRQSSGRYELVASDIESEASTSRHRPKLRNDLGNGGL